MSEKNEAKEEDETAKVKVEETEVQFDMKNVVVKKEVKLEQGQKTQQHFYWRCFCRKAFKDRRGMQELEERQAITC
jgi:hypothetical protein